MYKRIIHRFWPALGAIVALAGGAQAQSPIPNLLDWQAMGGSGAIQSATSFTLKNVTDKDTLSNGGRSQSQFAAFNDSAFGYAAPPRTFGVMVSFALKPQ